jgi:hypothetical protein
MANVTGKVALWGIQPIAWHSSHLELSKGVWVLAHAEGVPPGVEGVIGALEATPTLVEAEGLDQAQDQDLRGWGWGARGAKEGGWEWVGRTGAGGGEGWCNWQRKQQGAT